jgi:hypothetical protein
LPLTWRKLRRRNCRFEPLSTAKRWLNINLKLPLMRAPEENQVGGSVCSLTA